MQDTTGNSDLGRYIRVVASYSSTAGSPDSAYRVSDYRVNTKLGELNSPPEFDPDEVAREVTEGMAGMAVGAPVTATDADRDVLNYILAGTGPDNDKFPDSPNYRSDNDLVGSGSRRGDRGICDRGWFLRRCRCGLSRY